jgi:hypothetical protein
VTEANMKRGPHVDAELEKRELREKVRERKRIEENGGNTLANN